MNYTVLHEMNGPTLVVFSGYMFGAWAFTDMFVSLNDFKVVIVDGIGCDKDLDMAERMPSILRDINALLLGRLGLEPFTLLGHSLGGFVAQEYAKAYPMHLGGLILLGSCSVDSFRQSHRAAAIPALDSLFRMSQDSFFTMTTFNIFSPEFLDTTPGAQVLKKRFMANYPDKASCLRQLSMLEGLLSTGSCETPIKVDTLVIYSPYDKIIPPDWVLQLQGVFQKSPTFCEINSSHMFMYERPVETSLIVKNWLMAHD